MRGRVLVFRGIEAVVVVLEDELFLDEGSEEGAGPGGVFAILVAVDPAADFFDGHGLSGALLEHLENFSFHWAMGT